MFVAIIRAESCPELLLCYLSNIIHPLDAVRIASLSRFRFPQSTTFLSLCSSKLYCMPDHLSAYFRFQLFCSPALVGSGCLCSSIICRGHMILADSFPHTGFTILLFLRRRAWTYGYEHIRVRVVNGGKPEGVPSAFWGWGLPKFMLRHICMLVACSGRNVRSPFLYFFQFARVLCLTSHMR